ncbi:MAG: glycosyltransferase, partial [Gemmatimonadaceae bacterium]
GGGGGGARITIVMGDEDGKASALNAGVRAATGEAIVFADTYQRFEPEAITKLVSALQRPRRGAVSGRLELSSPAGGGAGAPKRRSAVGIYWAFERWLRRREAEVHSSIGVTGAIYCMWKSLWTPLPAGLILDDVFAPMSLVLKGYRVGFEDDARAFETRQPDRTQEYRRKVRTLTGVFQLCAWLPSVLIPVLNPVWLQFVFHKLLRLLTPYCVLVIALWLAAVVLRAGTVGAAVFLAAVLVLAALLVAGNARPVRHLREVLVQGLQMQAAVIVGTVNGFRGRWDVWRR